MTLPKLAIEEFKVLYKNRFGVELTNDEAERRANNLYQLYRAVYTNDSKEKNKVLQRPTQQKTQSQ